MAQGGDCTLPRLSCSGGLVPLKSALYRCILYAYALAPIANAQQMYMHGNLLEFFHLCLVFVLFSGWTATSSTWYLIISWLQLKLNKLSLPFRLHVMILHEDDDSHWMLLLRLCAHYPLYYIEWAYQRSWLCCKCDVTTGSICKPVYKCDGNLCLNPYILVVDLDQLWVS